MFILKRFKAEFTPLRLFSIILLAVGIIDHLVDPTEIIGNRERTILELSIQAFFIFCGVIGLLGGSKTAKLRSVVISIPFLYLSTLYTIESFQSRLVFATLPAIITGAIGLWSAFYGDNYERRTDSIDSSILSWYITKYHSKVVRDEKE